MTLVKGSERMITAADTNPSEGIVRWSPIKSIWMGTMTLVALVAGPLTFTWDGFAVFLSLSTVTLCAGHSVGMHRRLIHGSFECPQWLEYAMVYLGVLVGMAGPIGMILQHEMRDWAQRQRHCHDYLCHRRGFWQDGYWQLHCDLELAHPPVIDIEPRVAGDKVYGWMERFWMWQQLPLGLLFLGLGGWSWVVWGIAVRVSACVTGHWLVGHFAHRQGPQSWFVRGAGVQGFDVPIAALISMGESWHNNHHAYPGSARLGILPDQPDPGWWLICVLKSVGLVWSIRTPENMSRRPELVRLDTEGSGCPFLKTVRELRG